MLKLQLFEEPGRYVKLTTLPVSIGRDSSNTLVLDDTRVSDFHAEIHRDSEGLYIVDLLSASGTLVNEQRVIDRFAVKAWDVIRIGTIDLEINDPNTCRPGSWVLRTESDLLSSQFYPLQAKTVVGRDPDCDLTIDWHLLSRQHAELLIEDGQLRVIDLDSRNGTYLNGERIDNDVAFPGDELRFDEQRFIVVGPSKTSGNNASDDDQTMLRGQNPEQTVLAGQAGLEPVLEVAEVAQPEVTGSVAQSHNGEQTVLHTAANDADETRFFATQQQENGLAISAFLVLQDGSAQGQRYALLQNTLSIGRAPSNDLVIEASGISRQHAQLNHSDGSWRLGDLGSRNGIVVNGIQVQEVELQRGDKIGMGKAEFVFECYADSIVDAIAVADAETVFFDKAGAQNCKPLTASSAKPVGKQARGGAGKLWSSGLYIFLVAVAIALIVFIWRSGGS